MTVPHRYCQCDDSPSTDAGSCANCGLPLRTGGHRQVVWAEDAKPGNARVDPPRHAEQMAMAMYQRVARRKPGVKRSRFGKTNLILAGVCAVLALALFPVDAALLHLSSGALALGALVLGIKGLMGY